MVSPELLPWDGWPGRDSDATQTVRIINKNILIEFLQLILMPGENDPHNCISERLFMQMADLLISEGYYEAGYR